ncbi:MAG: hypothetical protein PHP17_05480 [Candidatus Omnitrophica bacterium]|nr:hypothetical protein [Candidatus Omnitrophota bacterium]
MANEAVNNQALESFTNLDKIAYKLLHIIFTIAPIIAGADKFFNFLTDWGTYLSPVIARAMPFNLSLFLRAAGVVEIIAGLLVAFIPKIGAFIVSAWLLLIIGNLLFMPGYFDIALRDLGLAVAAFSLGLMSIKHQCKCVKK